VPTVQVGEVALLQAFFNSNQWMSFEDTGNGLNSPPPAPVLPHPLTTNQRGETKWHPKQMQRCLEVVAAHRAFGYQSKVWV
jgi:hypothetical protein